MCAFHANQQLRLLEQTFDPVGMLRNQLTKGTPWDSISEFATSDAYCGLTLYPRQHTLLKLVFLETEQMTAYDLDVIEEWRRNFTNVRNVFGVQPDIWERVEYLKRRGYRRFPHIQFVLGRRASKGYLGAIIIVEMIAYLISLDNPQAHYGIMEGKDVFCNIGATSQTQAQRHQFADVRNVVEHCKWLEPYIAETKDHQLRLRTPADLRNIAGLKAREIDIEHVIATLWVVALSASSVAGRGATSYVNAFDEFAFLVSGSGSVKSSEEIYEDWQPSLGQFKKDALTFVPSSPFTKVGKFFELYQQGRVLMKNYRDDSGLTDQAQAELRNMQMRNDLDEVELAAEPGKLIFQGTSWELYKDWEHAPKLIAVRFGAAPENDLRDEEQQRRKLRNPEKFAVEREGQFAEVMGQYLDSAKVDAIFKPVEWRDPQVLEPAPFGRFDYTYRIHVDPSKCLTGDSLIQTSGGLVSITQVRAGNMVATRDGLDEVVEFAPNGVKPVFKLTLERGWQLRGTGNHPMWTQRGWVPIEDLLSTDKIQVRVGADLWPLKHVDVQQVSIPLRGNTRWCPRIPRVVDESLGRLMGYITAEGSLRENHLAITCHTDEPMLDECVEIIKDQFGISPSWEKIRGKARTIAWTNRHLTAIFDSLGMEVNLHSSQKMVPWSILQSPKSVAAQFLAAYFSGDGNVSAPHAKNRAVEACSASEQLMRQIQLLLGNFGIHSSQYPYWQKVREGVRKQYWKMSFRGHNLVRFRDEIGFVGTFPDKQDRLEHLANLPHDPPEAQSVFLKIRSIESDGQEETYDLSMLSSEHNFLANGMVCHNTGANFALCIAHTELAPPDPFGEQWPHVIIDRLHVWQPRDFPINPETGKHEVDYTLIERELDEVLYTFPSTTKFSSDQWNSAGFLQRLKMKYSPNIRVVEETATEKANYQRAEKFKSAVNLGWVHSFADTLYDDEQSLLELECKFLSEKNGKVVKQDFGPVTTKDLYDAVSVVVTDLLHQSLERWSGGELNAHSFGSTNKPDLTSGRAQERGAIANRAPGINQDGHRGQGRQSWEKLEALNLGSRRPDPSRYSSSGIRPRDSRQGRGLR